MRRTLPVAITIVFGVLYIITDGLSNLTSWRVMLDQWNNVSGGWAIALAAISLTMVHARNLRRADRAPYSATLLISMYGMIVFGLINGRAGLYATIFDNTAGVLEGVVLSSVCFYIVSSSYRAFRLRSAEATVMMISALFVMLSNVIGESIHPQLPLIGRWLMEVPNAAGMRAITIGAALGGAATAIRVLVGIERTHLGGE